MKARGYEMPKLILVLPDTRDRAQDEHVHASVGKATVSGMISDAISGRVVDTRNTMTIEVPGSLPSDVSFDDAVLKSYGGDDPVDGKPLFIARTFKDIIVHEMGHVQTEPDLSGQAFSDQIDALHEPGFSLAAKQVSKYATTNNHEFIAEAFSLQYKGGTLSPDAAKVYAALQGPKVRS